jgi:hypothetical protein
MGISLEKVKHDTKAVDVSEFFGDGSEKVIFEIQKFTRKTHNERDRIFAENATPEAREKAMQVCADIRARADKEADQEARQKLLDSADVEQQIIVSGESMSKIVKLHLLGGVFACPLDEPWNEATIDRLEALNQPLLKKLLDEIEAFNRPPKAGNSAN